MVATAFVLNTDSKKCVDHIDNNRRNNNANNLRWVTSQENHFNQQISLRNKSGVKGVGYDADRNKWTASIRLNGKTINVGRYNSLAEATIARQKKAKELFGEYVNSCEI